MDWYTVPAIALTLIGVAVALEFYWRNDSVRPLSKHALNKRRWDDPNNCDRLDASVPASLVGSSITCGHSRYYRISKDPAEQAKVLAG